MAKAGSATTKKKRTRKPSNYILGWVNETAADVDDEGNDIPGTERLCFVHMDLPPGLDDGQKRNRDAIKRACRRAVYDQGQEEFGNKKLAVLNYDEIFEIPFEKQEVVRLCPPGKGKRRRSKPESEDGPEGEAEAEAEEEEGED